MNNNAKQLRRLMRMHRLTQREVAGLTGRGLSTVKSWLGKPGTKWCREMPDHALELLRLKLPKVKT